MTSSILRSAYAAGAVLDQVQRRLMPALRGVLRVPPRCLVLGHHDEIGRERHRLFLRCARCGRETPGWAIGPQRDDDTLVVEPRRPRHAPAARAATMSASAVVLRDWSQARIAEASEEARQTLVRARAAWSRLERAGIRFRLQRPRWPGSRRR